MKKPQCPKRPPVFRVYHEADGSMTIKYRCPLSGRAQKLSATTVDELRKALESVPKG